MKIDWVALSVFVFFFLAVTVIGFVAARWRRGDLNKIEEWGLAGRRFGTVISWFLLGGDLYTAYTFIAVPGLVFAIGAQGFYAVPYTILVYPLIFILMPIFWSVCKKHGYVTPADFVEGRYGSKTLALLVAITGILATMPYIALQMFGIAVSVAQMGINPEVALVVAFLVLAAYTYFSGLRAPALIAIVKDTMIFIVLIAALVFIPLALGGFGPIFHAAQLKAPTTAAAAATTPKLTVFHYTLAPAQFLPYTTLALGSALALFLYPHSLTGTLSSSSRDVVKRNAALLPIYSLMLGLLALLGYMAIAAHVTPLKAYGANGIVPALIAKEFPSWFAGFAFAAIAIGALVPASIMSIAAANLFTRNIYRAYIRPSYSEREETTVARITSLVVKLGALLFIILIAPTYVIDFQLLGGIIIIQTLPAVFLGLFSRWFNRWALVVGWVVGITSGIYWFVGASYTSTYVFTIGGNKYAVYSAVTSVALNLVIAVVLTPIFSLLGLRSGKDVTSAADYTAAVPEVKEAIPEALG